MSYSRVNIPVQIRRQVHAKYDSHCAYCGCKLEYKDMQVDHLIAVARGGEQLSFENLMPSCRACNYYKRARGLTSLRRDIEKQLYKSLERSFDYRLAKKYGLLQETPRKIQFFFETYDSTQYNIMEEQHDSDS